MAAIQSDMHQFGRVKGLVGARHLGPVPIKANMVALAWITPSFFWGMSVLSASGWFGSDVSYMNMPLSEFTV